MIGFNQFIAFLELLAHNLKLRWDARLEINNSVIRWQGHRQGASLTYNCQDELPPNAMETSLFWRRTTMATTNPVHQGSVINI